MTENERKLLLKVANMLISEGPETTEEWDVEVREISKLISSIEDAIAKTAAGLD